MRFVWRQCDRLRAADFTIVEVKLESVFDSQRILLYRLTYIKNGEQSICLDPSIEADGKIVPKEKMTWSEATLRMISLEMGSSD